MRLCISIFHTKSKILYIKLFMCNIIRFVANIIFIESRNVGLHMKTPCTRFLTVSFRIVKRSSKRSSNHRPPQSFLSKEPVGNVSLSISHATWFPGQMHLFGHLKPGLTFPGCHNVPPNDAWRIRSYCRFIKINKEEFSKTHTCARITCATF